MSMVQTPENTGQNVDSKSALQNHNLDIKAYVPWHERVFRLHSRKIARLVELYRPNLNVVELGAGPGEFLNRAKTVARGGGRFTAIDHDPTIVGIARENLKKKEDNGRIVPGSVDIRQGNSNAPLREMQLENGTSDVVIINSVAANATPGECRAFLEDLIQQQKNRKDDESLGKAIEFLKNFNASIPEGLPSHYPLEGVKGNVLMLVNAFLALKKGGKLVYAHNDQSMIHAATQQVQVMCRGIGFDDNNIRVFDPYYNVLNIKDIFLIRPSQYDMGIVTAEK